MIRQVRNISRAQFRRINSSSSKQTKDDHAFISIYGTEWEEQPPPKINQSIWMDGIQLMFDDVDSDYSPKNMKSISNKQSDIIVEFVRRIHEHPSDIDLIIHCFAGISRSAGVGKFINDILGLDLPNYRNLRLCNATVYRNLINEKGTRP
jgi:predicted protein tyrosine phosphatase